MEKYKKLIETALYNAEHYISKLPNDILYMDGMSGLKTRHFYNNLLNTDDARYLEIGTWKGSSACSAMFGNNATIVVIDNWSHPGSAGEVKNEFLHNFNRFKGMNQTKFIEQDSFTTDVSTLPSFNIYMYDGDHTSESHYKALQHYYDCLDDIFIYVVDDWNDPHVRNGTERAIHDLKLNVLYEKKIRLTWDDTHSPQPLARDTWWNGVYIGILQKTK